MKKISVLLAILVLAVVLSTFTVGSALEFNGFTYEVADGAVTITGYVGSEVNVVIPETIDTYPVTAIGETAFSGNATLESITLPASVKQVKSLLDSCANLKRIYIPNIAFWFETQFAGNLLTGGRELYVNGALLEDLVIPETVTEVKFTGYTHLKSVTVHSQVKSVDFTGCENIKAVYIQDLKAWCETNFAGENANPLTYAEKLYVNNTELSGLLDIPQGTTKINDYAFWGFKGIQALNLPATVTEIGAAAFTGAAGLAQIFVDTSNAQFSASEGVLFNKDGTQLLHYPAGKTDVSYTIPVSVITIADGAIRKCENLKNVIIGDNVTAIGMRNLCESNALESVTIGKGVNRIGSYVLSACPNLQTMEIADIAAWCAVQLEGEESIFSSGAELYLNGEPLTKVVIPESVTTISKNAFWMCATINEVALHNKLEIIEERAFFGNTNLFDVWYIGSEEERGKLQIKEGNDALTKAQWHYNACPVGADHDWVWVADVPETCGDDGLQHEECSFCHIMQNKNTKLPANGNHVYDNPEDSGCNVCNQTREAGHNFRWVTTVEPTCATEGSKYEQCTHCSEIRNPDTVIPALLHAMGQWVITKEAACEVKGEIVRECAMCGHTETDFLIALEHNYIPTGTSKQPTCTEDGKDVAKCTLCGQEKITVLKAPGHKFHSVVVKEPTEDELGLRRKTCEVCNTVKEEPIPATRQVGTTSVKSVLMIILAVVVLLGSAAGIFYIIKTRDKTEETQGETEEIQDEIEETQEETEQIQDEIEE